MDESAMTEFCVRNLVQTNIVVLEKEIAFPVCSDIAAGISYWLYEGKRRGINYEAYQEASKPPRVCSLSIHELKDNNKNIDSELLQMKLCDFSFPLLFFGACCLIAIIFRLHRCFYKKQPSNSTIKKIETTIDHDKCGRCGCCK